MKIHKGDTIVVVQGKDLGKKGRVEFVNKKNATVTVPDINTYKKHAKKSQQFPQGGVLELTRPIASSKVMVVCTKCNKPTRVGYKVEGDSKLRICRKCKSVL